MNKKGFTLIELLAVVIIIGLISILLAPKIIERFEYKKEEISKEAKELLYLAASQYMELKKDDTITCITIRQLIDNGYLIDPVIDTKTNIVISDTASIKVTKTNNQYNYELSDACN